MGITYVYVFTDMVINEVKIAVSGPESLFVAS